MRFYPASEGKPYGQHVKAHLSSFPNPDFATSCTAAFSQYAGWVLAKFHDKISSPMGSLE